MLYGLQIWLPQIPPPPKSDLVMENLGILCGLQIWLPQITPPPVQIGPSHEELCGDFNCIVSLNDAA